MQNNPIGVFDSGIGGLSVLKTLIKILPNESFYYYGDTKNNPYGEKSQSELEKITVNIVQNLITKQQVKMIVIACNTATTTCMKFLRQQYPDMIFVGSEPAIKNAAESAFQNILVMATPDTIVSARTQQLVQQYQQPHQKITLLPCKGLADAIEHHNQKSINQIFKNIILNHQAHHYDAVVLGCTHYVLIKDQIQSIFPTAQLLDGNEGIAKRAQQLLQTHHLQSTNQTPGTVQYFYSK